ncbi:MAG: hypothetical protein H6867_06160 [Rhodospirillales bacterium]|nr:hypothetical protein [Rhodospirillales bacterium]MCB9995113.1 hypothetical protein [Rhodospirillales bacterium]
MKILVKNTISCVVLIIFLSSYSLAQANENICMSDEELHAYLESQLALCTGAISGVCAGKYTDMHTEIFALAESIEKQYADEAQRYVHLSSQPFIRIYGDKGVERRNEALESDCKLAIENAQTYTVEQCQNHIGYWKALLYSEDWALATEKLIEPIWQENRNKVSKCRTTL